MLPNRDIKTHVVSTAQLLKNTIILKDKRPRLTTAEKDEIAREVSAISDCAAALIMDDDDDEFQRYVEATAKYGRTPTGLKFDHYSNADFVKRRDSRIAAHAESYADYKRIMAIDSMKSRIDQSTEQTRTVRRSRSTSQRSEGRATALTDLTEYSANSDEIRKIFALSAKPDDSKDQINRSEQIQRWELDAQKLIARAPSRKRDKLQKVHDNWAQSYEVSFRDYVKFMSDAFSLPSNSDPDQSRNSDYDMFDDEDKEGDNREINHSSPDDNDLSRWSDKQWYNFFARSMVPNPPLMSNATASVHTLSRAIRAHWIAAEDFGIHGRFYHVFIPNYVYLPKDILTAIGKVTLNVTDVHYHLICQKLYRARQAATAAYQLQHTERKPYKWIEASPWVNILEDVQVAKPCFTEHLDVLQNRSAIQKTPFATLHGTARSVIYDRFFCPLERLIAIDMPLHERLLEALSSDIETDNLAKIFTKLAGLPGLPDHVQAAYVMEHMSTVRHLHSSAFTPLRATQTPPHRMVPRTKVIAGDKEFSVHGNDRHETSEPYMDLDGSKPKTFESRYFVAQRKLRENFSAINNIQKRVEQLKLATRTSVSSDDFTNMKIERMKLLDQIGFINIGNIRLMKDLHQMTEQRLNDSKRHEMRSSSMHEMVTFHSMDHQEIATLLNRLDDWYEERKADRLRLKALKKQVDAFQITKSFVPSFDESL
jgi:hypothetical protein